MIKTILFATDLGAFTIQGLAHVESLAESLKADIHIVHALPPIGQLTAAVVRTRFSDKVQQELLHASNIPGLLDTLKEQIFEMLLQEPFEESDLATKVKDIAVLCGQPAAVILEESERIKADLIVVGSHSVDALDGRMLGGVAAKVLQLSKTPVYLVPMMNPAALSSSPVRSDHRFRI